MTFLLAALPLLVVPCRAAESSAVAAPISVDLTSADVLVSATTDSDPVIVRVAALALASMGDARSVGPLARFSLDSDAGTRSTVVTTLKGLRLNTTEIPRLIATAAGGDYLERRWGTALLARMPFSGVGDSLLAGAKVLLGPASLAWTVGVAAIFAGLGVALIKMIKPRLVPGPAGWVLLGGLIVAAVLYWPAMIPTPGGIAFSSLALAPAGVALLTGLLLGGWRWNVVRQQMAGFACLTHYHRFVPGPKLGLLERWSGRLLLKHRGAGADTKDLAGDTVCRACGGTGRFAGVKQVVAVLDHAASREAWQDAANLRVNWLRYRKPFDFQRVEIVRAGSTEVEEFVQQARFQADESVRRGLGKMVCVVGTQARIEDSTLRVLRPVFGRVDVEGA